MTEWGVVGVLVVLVGLIVTISGPIIKLNTNITKLTMAIKNTTEDVTGLTTKHDDDMRKNSESHARIWEHNKMQDEKITDHDKRIHVLERK
ncbi:hypothetical protein LJC60_06305 [Ruminococcaceae bacterium OttesenSCG-928-D13]|nr:hypothetical protein [Ruminococcaceae bacterium OttesenSCG-928-D13]